MNVVPIRPGTEQFLACNVVFQQRQLHFTLFTRLAVGTVRLLQFLDPVPELLELWVIVVLFPIIGHVGGPRVATTISCLPAPHPGLYFGGTVGSFQPMGGSMSLIGLGSCLAPSHPGLYLCGTVGTNEVGRRWVVFLWGGPMPLLGFGSCLPPTDTGLNLCGTVGTHQLGRRCGVF